MSEIPVPCTNIYCDNPECDNYRNADARFTVSVTYATDVSTRGKDDADYLDATNAEADFRCALCEDDAEEGEPEDISNLPNIRLFCDTLGCDYRRSTAARFVKKEVVCSLVTVSGEVVSGPSEPEDEEAEYYCHLCDCRALVNPNYQD